MVVTVVASLDQFNQIIAQDEVSVFDFWSPLWGPCKTISPYFEKLSNLNDHDYVKFYKVNVDEHQDIALEAKVRELPHFIAFRNGEANGGLVGADPAALTTLIQMHAV